MKRTYILALAALLSLAAAAFQVVLGLVPRWSALLEAPESLLARPALLLTASLVVAILFGVCAVYAASGAGYIRKVPFLRTVLLGAGTVFLLRGWVFVPMLLVSLGVIYVPQHISAAAFWTSGAFFLLAVLYLAGALANWRTLHSAHTLSDQLT